MPLHFGFEPYIPYVLYIAAIAAFLGSIFHKPIIGIYFLLPMIPLQTMRYRLGQFPLGASLVGVILLGVLLGCLREGKPVLRKTPWTGILIVYGVFTFLSLWMGSFYIDRPVPLPGDARYGVWQDYMMMPALLLNYFGQGALILNDPSAADNPFYKLAPAWALIPMVVLATFATIIASQALISGVFSLTRQAMQMGLSPRANIVPTSGDEAGQIYVPAANWLLMTGTLFTVLLFRSSESLAAAYGIAVSGTMLITTILLYRVAVSRWGWRPAIAIPVIAAFGAIDCFFLVSNSFKIAEGGWFPLVVGTAIAVLMLSWRRGSSEVRRRLLEMSMPLEKFIPYADNAVIGRSPGLGVWLTKVEHGASPMLLRHIEHNCVLHEKVVLLTFVSDRRPRVPFGERHSVHRLGHGFYRITVRLGFMQTPDIPRTLKNCQMLGFNPDLDHVHYFIAHEIIVRRDRDSAMPAVPFAIFAFLTRIASRAPDFFRIPHEGLSEVGFRVEI